MKDAPEMEKAAADRIYKLIVSSSYNKVVLKKDYSTKRKKFLRYASVAAVLVCLMTGGYFTFRQGYIVPIDLNITIPNENVTTLELGNSKVQIIDPNVDKQVYDAHGNIIGRQIRNSLVYDTGEASNALVYNVLKVPYGKRFNLVLSDGTLVYLNAGTSIRYPVKFQKVGNRQVFLSGEAFFEVTENKEKPFIVATDDGMKVKVLGTSFNVKSYPEDKNIETTLTKGKVRIVDQNLQEEVELIPSEKAIYHKLNEEVVVEGVDTNQFTSWKDGVLIYDETPMRQVIKDLERTYNVTFEVESNTILNYKYKGVFDNLTIDQILKLFELSSPIKCKIVNNKIIIMKDENKKADAATSAL